MLKKVLLFMIISFSLALPVYATSGDTLIDSKPILISQERYDYFDVESDLETPTSEENTLEDPILGSILFGFMGFWWLFILSIICLSFLSLAFNIWMLIDCIQRDFDDKTLWMVLLILGIFLNFGLIVSILYYFLVKKKLDEK